MLTRAEKEVLKEICSKVMVIHKSPIIYEDIRKATSGFMSKVAIDTAIYLLTSNEILLEKEMNGKKNWYVAMDFNKAIGLIESHDMMKD